MQSVIILGICSSLVPSVPTLRCHVPHISAKSVLVLKKAPEVTIDSAGDQLQDSAVTWRVAAYPALQLLVKRILANNSLCKIKLLVKILLTSNSRAGVTS